MKIKNERIAALVVLCFILANSSSLPSATAAGGGNFQRMREGLDGENNLNIGIPDFPRKVGRELPNINKNQGIKAGIFRLHPSFTSSFTYEDNVELANAERSKEKQDGYFTERPALAAEMKAGKHRFEGGYGMEIQNFLKYEEENKVNHMAYGLAEFNFNDFQILVEDNFEKSTSRLYSETSARDHLMLNEVHVMGRYDRPKWATELGWTHNTVEHITDQFKNSNYDEDIFAVLGGYKILPKTLLLAEFDLGNVYYDRKVRAADQTYFQILGGVRGEPTQNIELTVKGGVQNRKLDAVEGFGEPTDYRGLVVNADFLYRVTPTDYMRLGYLRTVKTSTFANSSWYREDKVYLSYRKRLFQKWYLTPSVSWQMNEYPESATVGSETLRRGDHFVQAGASLRYRIRQWLWTGIAYNFQSRDSKFNSLDYDSNRITADISLIY